VYGMLRARCWHTVRSHSLLWLVIVPDGVGGALGPFGRRRTVYLSEKPGILIMPMCVCLSPVLLCALEKGIMLCASRNK
jgi:hypothetical protein